MAVVEADGEFVVVGYVGLDIVVTINSWISMIVDTR